MQRPHIVIMHYADVKIKIFNCTLTTLLLGELSSAHPLTGAYTQERRQESKRAISHSDLCMKMSREAALLMILMLTACEKNQTHPDLCI